MATAVSWVLGSVLMFLEFGVVACSALGSPRRSRFYLRLGCAWLVMSALGLGLALAIEFSALPQRLFGPAWVVLLLVAIAVPATFCYQTFTRSPGPSDGDASGGPGSGPPPPPPGPPWGGTPLADADQSRTRRRDHGEPSPGGPNRRRPAAEPAPRGTPAGPRRR